MIFHKEGSAYNLGIKLADKINDWLYNYQHPIQIHIGSDGDPFASHVYRHFMEHTPEKENIKYTLQRENNKAKTNQIDSKRT